MLYTVIKYFLISNNIASMNLERRFHIFYRAFYFIDINNIEYFSVGIPDDGISSFTITLSNIFLATIM